MNSDCLRSNKIGQLAMRPAVMVMLIPICHMAVHPLLSDAMDCLGIVAPPCMYINKLAVNELLPLNAHIQNLDLQGKVPSLYSFKAPFSLITVGLT